MTTTPQRFTKRPVTIEAIQWDGTQSGATPIIDWILDHDRSADYWAPGEWDHETNAAYINITTLEGNIIASRDDWIIRGVQGEFYPCKPDVFAQTYEPAAERMQPEQAGPTDAEVRAAAEEAEKHEPWGYDENGVPYCECGAILAESEHDFGGVPSSPQTSQQPSGSETTMSEREEYTPPMDEIKRWYAGDVSEYRCDTGMSEEDGEMAFDRAIAAHDRALREQIARGIEQYYLGPDSGRRFDGRDAPDAAEMEAFDEGLQLAARIARGEGSE